MDEIRKPLSFSFFTFKYWQLSCNQCECEFSLTTAVQLNQFRKGKKEDENKLGLLF